MSPRPQSSCLVPHASCLCSDQFQFAKAQGQALRLLKPGDYDIYVSVGSSTGTPRIALPLPADDGHRRYRLGKLKVSPPAQK